VHVFRDIRIRRYLVILIVAMVIGFGFRVWEWSDYCASRPSTLSEIYFVQGFGLAAGYGYVQGIGKPGSTHLRELYKYVTR
jgi:hypothetical protein